MSGRRTRGRRPIGGNGSASGAAGNTASMPDLSAFSCRSEAIGRHSAVVTVSGELDLDTAPQVREIIARLRAEGAGRHLLFDLSGLTFMDSTGVGVLVAAQRQAEGPLHVVVADNAVRKIIAVTGLEKVFAVHSSREEALRALEAQVHAA